MRRPLRRTMPALIAGVVAVAGWGCSSEAATPVGLDGRVVIRDFGFRPDSLVVQVGQQTSIVIENEDDVIHSFTSSVLGAADVGAGELPRPRSVDIPPGESRRVDFLLSQVPEQLTTPFSCRFHGFDGMTGTIRIVP